MNAIKFIMIFIFSVFVNLLSANDDEFRKAYDKFMEVSNANSVMFGDEPVLSPIYKQLRGILNEKQLEDFKAYMKQIYAEMEAEAMEASYEIYKKYFSLEDIKYLIEFYQTEQGKKYAQALPDIWRETFDRADDFTKKYMPRIQEKIESILENRD